MTAKTNDIELSLRSKVRHVRGEGCERKKKPTENKGQQYIIRGW